MSAVATVGAVVLDCPDPGALAAFYAAVLGGEVTGQGAWVELEGAGMEAGGATLSLAFQAAPDFVPPTWPAVDGSQQFHLDLTVGDLDAAEERVLALGARLLDGAGRRTFRVYADPAGHPFCLCAGRPQ